MAKDNIRDFIDAWGQWDGSYHQNLNNPRWSCRFEEAGYYNVEVDFDASTWALMHTWLQEHVGYEHYAHQGNDFWFDSEQDAILFALKWSK